MHSILAELNRIASGHYARTQHYPRHVYVGAVWATRIKKDILLKLIRSDPKQQTDVRDLKKLTILGMRLHPRLSLVDKIIVAHEPLTDEQIMREYPAAPAAAAAP